MDNKQSIVNSLSALVGLTAEELAGYIETPPSEDMGDFSFPCFKLAKTLRKAPPAIAAELCAKLSASLPEGIEKVCQAGGYINFYAAKSGLVKNILERALSLGERYGSSDMGQKRNVCVEFSSINIAKPVHIGHLPSTAIGNSLYRIYGFMGFNPIAINHLGDWGTQFGKMIVAYKKWGSKELVEKEGVRGLVGLYVRFHEEAEAKPELNDEARAWFRKIELGDKEALELWNWFKELSLKDVMKVYDTLDVKFDSYAGESFYEDKMQAVIDELEIKGVSKVDKGATIVDLSEYNMPPCIIVKSDGGTIYATRDIACAKYRKATYNFYKSLYVVAYQQNLHFKQFFKVLELLGDAWVKDCEHVNFGMVSVEDGTLSTRHGKIVYLEDVLNKAIESTAKIIAEKSPQLTADERALVARQVGAGAVVWAMLYNSRIKDVQFSWDKTLNFDGETGPYAQYTHARSCSVLRKAGDFDKNIDYSRLEDASSVALVKAIGAFPDAVAAAMEKNEPYLVARATMDICSCFNKFYFDCRIMDDDPATRCARLALTLAAKNTIKTGLWLVGLAAPERM